ncbi:hypothetical protein ACOSP7_028834 [Xanthoceras sorbifolium]
MSTSRKKLLINTVSVSLGCSSCRKPKLSFLFHPKSRPTKPIYRKHSNYNNSSSSTSSHSHSHNTNLTQYYSASATTFSPTLDTTPSHWDTSCRPVRGFGRVGGESVAKEDLKELLNCFLQLNSPYHHEIIVRAFTEIWNGVFSVKTGMASSKSKLRFGCKSRDF